jgi:hypothetical protein
VRTIGRHWPRGGPRLDYQAACSYCGVHWRRSQLRRDGAGNFACPDEGRGRDQNTLTQLNALHTRQARYTRPRDGAPYDNDDGSVDPPQRTTADDIEL